MTHDQVRLPVHLPQRLLQRRGVPPAPRELVSHGIVTVFCVGQVDIHHPVEQSQRREALVAAAVPHHRQRETVLGSHRKSLQQHREHVRGGDEVRVGGAGFLQIEQQRGELRGRRPDHVPSLQRE